MIKQVWLNLIDNAIKFATPKTDILITARKEKSDLIIGITDTGKEICEDEYESIFNKFYQSDKSRSTEGNGIGLSIVKSILDLHSASISVRSENGKTTFTVTFKDV